MNTRGFLQELRGVRANLRAGHSSPSRADVSLGDWRLEIEHLSQVAWEQLCKLHWATVADLVESEILYRPTYDILWIEKADRDEHYWMVSVGGEHRSNRRVMIIQRKITT